MLALHMPRQEGGCAVAFVFAGILAIADTDLFLIEQADDGGDDTLLVQRLALQIAVDLAPNFRQRFAEFHAVRIFVGFSAGPVILVVAILAAPPGVDSNRLDMTVGVGREPGLGIGGWRGQTRLSDALVSLR